MVGESIQSGRDISPMEAWEMLVGDKKAILIDVRTKEEWLFVGTPCIDEADQGSRLFMIEWRQLPLMEINSNFIKELQLKVDDQKTKLVFLCRSGQRSAEVCEFVGNRGYAFCYNVEGGFEGPLSDKRHRGEVCGWKKLGLHWRQS